MPTTPRSLQAICKACLVRNSADCLVDAQGLRLHNSTDHCPIFTQHAPSSKLSYTKKLFDTKTAVHASSYNFLTRRLLPTHQLPKRTDGLCPIGPNQQGWKGVYNRKGATKFITRRQLKRWTAQGIQIQPHMADKYQMNRSSSNIPINRL